MKLSEALIVNAWNELATAEHECFNDALSFHTVRPILEKFALAVAHEIGADAKRVAELGKKTGASPWT